MDAVQSFQIRNITYCLMAITLVDTQLTSCTDQIWAILFLTTTNDQNTSYGRNDLRNRLGRHTVRCSRSSATPNSLKTRPMMGWVHSWTTKCIWEERRVNSSSQTVWELWLAVPTEGPGHPCTHLHFCFYKSIFNWSRKFEAINKRSWSNTILLSIFQKICIYVFDTCHGSSNTCKVEYMPSSWILREVYRYHIGRSEPWGDQEPRSWQSLAYTRRSVITLEADHGKTPRLVSSYVTLTKVVDTWHPQFHYRAPISANVYFILLQFF